MAAKKSAKKTTKKRGPIAKKAIQKKPAPKKRTPKKKPATQKRAVANKKPTPKKQKPAAKKKPAARAKVGKKSSTKQPVLAPKSKRSLGGTILQTVSFAAPPEVIYEALLDGEMHSAFTGSVANVQARVGTKFNAWDGYIHGMVMELDPPHHIVKSWRASDFPQAHPMSRLQIDLTPTSDGGTTLEMRHTGLPESMVGDYDNGWHEHYWKPLRAWLANKT